MIILWTLHGPKDTDNRQWTWPYCYMWWIMTCRNLGAKSSSALASNRQVETFNGHINRFAATLGCKYVVLGLTYVRYRTYLHFTHCSTFVVFQWSVTNKYYILIFISVSITPRVICLPEIGRGAFQFWGFMISDSTDLIDCSISNSKPGQIASQPNLFFTNYYLFFSDFCHIIALVNVNISTTCINIYIKPIQIYLFF